MGRHHQDLRSARFGRLVVVKFASPGPKENRSTRWLCVCDCGNFHVTSARSLKNGSTKSCGCLAHEVRQEHARTTLRNANVTHGQSSSWLYHEYQTIRTRCENPRHKYYCNYGGRFGASAFPYQNFEQFEQAIAALGERPSPRHSLDRINNDRGYAPDNLQWALPKEQNKNRRPTRSRLEIDLERELEEMRVERLTSQSEYVAA